MLLWYITFFVLGIVFIGIFIELGVGFFQAYLYTVTLVCIIYYVIAIIRGKNRLHILDEVCDPEAFISLTINQKQRMKRNKKLQALLSIDEAVGYMLLDDYGIAKAILEETDKSYLLKWDSTLLVHTIDYIICCFEVGEIEEALELMNTKLLELSPYSKRIKRSVEILIGDRYYYLGRYDECYQHLSALLDIELSRRQHLGILYRLAQIDVLRGDDELAKKKYQKIAKFGNKLGIATEARKYLEKNSDK